MRALVVLCGAVVCSSLTAQAVDTAASGETVQAAYETRFIAKNGATDTRRWTFRRHPNWVEYHWQDLGVTEHWRIDARGNVSYTEVFHRERTIVRYTSGDLATLGIDPQWHQLDHVVIPPRNDTTFTPVFVSQAGEFGQRYTTQDQTSRSSVVWLEEFQLPAEVRSTTRLGRRIHLRLLEIERVTPSSSPARERSYRTIDFADFGDMEYDPFVRAHSRHSHALGATKRHGLRTPLP